MSLDPSTLNVILGTALSCIGLYLGFKRFNLKSGISIWGSYSSRASIACEDDYICKINLENKKDKAVTIFAIYLRIYPNYYLTIQNFEDSPLILKGFETYQSVYDPIDFYTINCNKVKIGDLLMRKKVKRRLVLATSEGKHVIKKQIKYWDPIGAFFENHWTGLIQPIRATHNGRGYGGNAKYIVEFKSETGQKESVPIYPKDYEIKKFKRFSLTKESLESKESLAAYLESLRSDGVISASDLTVHDLERLREDRFELYTDRREHDLPRIGWLKYFIAGRVATLISDWKLKQKNKASKKKQESKAVHTNPLPVPSRNLNDDSNP